MTIYPPPPSRRGARVLLSSVLAARAVLGEEPPRGPCKERAFFTTKNHERSGARELGLTLLQIGRPTELQIDRARPTPPYGRGLPSLAKRPGFTMRRARASPNASRGTRAGIRYTRHRRVSEPPPPPLPSSTGVPRSRRRASGAVFKAPSASRRARSRRRPRRRGPASRWSRRSPSHRTARRAKSTFRSSCSCPRGRYRRRRT